MITLNGARGFEEINSWEEITQLPGFTDALNPEHKQLQEIIARYIFKDKIACGLTSCKQPHGRGYIVVTESGEVTNIGNVCGMRHFGVKFEEYSKVFTQAVTDYQNRELITSFLFQLEAHIDRVRQLRSEDFGADWIYKTSRALVEKNHGCPDSVVREISKMVRGRNGEISKARLADDEEHRKMELAAGKELPKPQFIEESLGHLQGLSALYTENDLRNVLILDVEPMLKDIALFDVDSATSRELRHWAKNCQEFDAKIELAEQTIQTGRLLLVSDNLAPISQLLADPKERSSYKKWVTGLPGART